MTRRLKVFGGLIFVLLLVSCTGTPTSNDYYVSIQGSDSTGNGSQSKPWRTIQYALDQAKSYGNSTIRINLAKGTPGQGVWQRGYYERVVRSEDELRSVREYIRLNPLKWRFDRENPLRVADPHYEREWAWIEAPRSQAEP